MTRTFARARMYRCTGSIQVSRVAFDSSLHQDAGWIRQGRNRSAINQPASEIPSERSPLEFDGADGGARTQIDQSEIRLFWFPAGGCALLCITRFPLHFHRLLTSSSRSCGSNDLAEKPRDIYTRGASRGLVHWNRGNLDL